MYGRSSIRVTHEPTGLRVTLDERHHRSFHKRKLLAKRLLRAKVAALERGGYHVVDGELVADVPPIDLSTTVETGTFREENDP